jgi:NAD(P)-dependent dehydrogenase (short-subunit alcohol dehydrogenase family)
VPHPAMTKDNVAVITGGASGIGLAAAMRFAARGMKVCIADLGADRLKEAEAKLSSASPAGGGHVMTAAVDVSRVDDLMALESAVQKRFGGTDILMNNAGISPGAKIFGPLENWQRLFAVNLWGVIHGSQVFAPHMIERRPARPHHQYRLQAGHHDAARQPRLQRFQGRGESAHRGAAA